MKNAIEILVSAIFPTPGGCVLFLEGAKLENEKVIMIYIDPSVGHYINEQLEGRESERPVAHDLFMRLVEGIGGEVTAACVTDVEDDVFFANLVVQVSNEVQHKKIVHMDCRPSDCYAIAIASDIPVYFSQDVWDAQPDVTQLLDELNDMGESKDDEDFDI